LSSGDGRLKAQGRSSNRLALTGKAETSRLRSLGRVPACSGEGDNKSG